MSDLVFDTEPLIAYVYDEPGTDRVQDLLKRVDAGDVTAAISEVTATEIVYKIACLQADGRPDEADLADGRQQVDSFVAGGIELVPPTESWPIAARVKAGGGDRARRRVRRCTGCRTRPDARRRCRSGFRRSTGRRHRRAYPLRPGMNEPLESFLNSPERH